MTVLQFKGLNWRPIFPITLLVICSACTKEISKNEELNASPSSLASKPNSADKLNTFYGPQVQMGNGKARSFLTVSHTGVPTELGIEMTDGSLTALPDNQAEAAFVLSLHQKAMDATPFDHILINWNAHGHPPFALFSEPHFDFHFYTMSLAERLAIPAYTANGPHDILPPPDYQPAGYFPTPGGEPQMGKHWVDLLHPVIPGTFTQTMIYGSFNGKLIFTEPMITRAFLQSGNDISMTFGQPRLYAETGTYYPLNYNIRDDASGKHYITLSEFMLR